MAYTEEQISEFEERLAAWIDREADLTTELFIRPYRNPTTGEFVRHGLGRRLATLKHCIQRAFEVLPPNEDDPGGNALMDATSFLQTFVVNVFSAIAAPFLDLKSVRYAPSGQRKMLTTADLRCV